MKAESLVNENSNEEIPMASSNSNNNTLYNDNVIHVLDIKVMIHYFSRYYDSFSLVAAKSQTIMSLYTLMETVLKLPNIVRKWWKDMKRGDNDRFAQFMSTSITPAIISKFRFPLGQLGILFRTLNSAVTVIVIGSGIISFIFAQNNIAFFTESFVPMQAVACLQLIRALFNRKSQTHMCETLLRDNTIAKVRGF